MEVVANLLIAGCQGGRLGGSEPLRCHLPIFPENWSLPVPRLGKGNAVGTETAPINGRELVPLNHP